MSIARTMVTITGIIFTVVGPFLGALSLVLFYLTTKYSGNEQTALFVGGIILATFGLFFLAGGTSCLAFKHKVPDDNYL